MVVAALAAGASAWTNETVFYTTEIVTAYTTYCPAATMVTHGSLTYTVTEVRRFPIEVPRVATEKSRFLNASVKISSHQKRDMSLPTPAWAPKANSTPLQATTLIITNCPCTVIKPVTSATVTYCPTWYPHCNLPQPSLAPD